MECEQLFLAAKEGNVATMETLLYDKYVDVNSQKLYEEGHYIITQVAMCVCVVIIWWLFIYMCMKV